MKLKFLDYLLIIGLIAFIIYFIAFSFNAFLFLMGFIFLVPYWLLTISKIVYELTTKKIIKIIANIIGFITFSIMIFCVGFFLISRTSIYEDLKPKPYIPKVPEHTVSIENYLPELNNLSDKEYRIEHFPRKIPENAKNYEFKIGTEKLLNYLVFDTNENYINKVYDKNKNKILRSGNTENVCASYVYICHQAKEKGFYDGELFIFENTPEDIDFTSGYAVSKNKDKIMFLYSDENLANRFHSSIGYYKPTREDYKYEIPYLANSYRIKHFPKDIPQEAYNYDFEIEIAFDGYNISTLKFNIDNPKYFDEIIEQNKNKIYKTVNFADVDTYFRDLGGHISRHPDEDKYTIYLLKFEPNKNNDKHYSSGFIISKENKEIIFFYSNYCLDTERDIDGNLLEKDE